VAAANLSHHTDDDFAGADVDGDGIDDLIIIERQSAAVTYMRGRPNGQFEVVQRIPIEGDAAHLGVGDFNADQLPDIAWVQGVELREIVVRLRDEFLRYGFAPNATIPLDASASWIVVADLNGDGRSDIVNGVANSTFVQARVAQSDGTFAAAVRSNIEMEFLRAPELHDANVDHALDLVGLKSAGSFDPFVPVGGPPMIAAGGRGTRFGAARVVDPGELEPGLRSFATTALLASNFDDDPALDIIVAYWRGKERTSGITVYNVGHCLEPVP
jgi:hypothetical protein